MVEQPPQPRFQFSVGSLFAITTFAAIWLALLSWIDAFKDPLFAVWIVGWNTLISYQVWRGWWNRHADRAAAMAAAGEEQPLVAAAPPQPHPLGDARS